MHCPTPDQGPRPKHPIPGMFHSALLLAAAALPQSADKIQPALREAVEEAEPGTHFRAYAVLGERLTFGDFLEENVGRLPRGERQLHVAERLRAYADERQGALLALLGDLRASGDVSRVDQLWIANAVVFRGNGTAVAAAAALSEVEYVAWDPVRDVSAYYDAACPAPAAPAPASTEPNIVEVQAEALWGLGFKGQGSVLLNIDDGVDYTHPDLAQRIWSNPLDPVDGVDNDGNGLVDDEKGWDFVDGDNDPFPGTGFFGTDTHGTNTAGIMVGDGSGGWKRTGMAPEAELVIARINGETDHWFANQYGISVAVDCSSSSHSYKWSFSPKPNYHMHRIVQDMVLAAGIIHTNSIGNQGGDSFGHPVPFQISAPGLSPAPWRHPAQAQIDGGVSGVMGCGAVLQGDLPYFFSSHGPSAWEDIAIYNGSYPWPQDPPFWDYPYGGFGGAQQGLVKPDVVAPTEVQTTTVGGGYVNFGGTSAATPHNGGALALLVSVNPAAEPRHLAQALQVTANDLGASGKDELFGAGSIRVLDAAKRLMHLIKVDDVAPSLGDTVTVTVRGNANAHFVSLWGYNSGETVTPLFAIDMAPPFFPFAGGFLDGSGGFVQAFAVPFSATLVGVDVLLQSGEDDTGGLTGEFLVSTLESFRIQS